MYRIRFHGRGGQGIKTAGRILGNAFFLGGFEVQDAPRYGAERRGAPMFAYVRANSSCIVERGVIQNPDLVVVADETLVPIPAADILAGVDVHTIMLVSSAATPGEWRHRLNLDGSLVTIPLGRLAEDPLERRYVGAACAGAAARLVGVLSRKTLEAAVRDELSPLGRGGVRQNLDIALEAYDSMAAHEGCVTEGESPSAEHYEAPEWVELPFDEARVSAPAIHAAATSIQVRTGLWRTMRPVIELDRCNRCWWVCSSLCPDSAIALNERGEPQIDYDHCKGCLVCVAQCPPHAIVAIPEAVARKQEGVAR